MQVISELYLDKFIIFTLVLARLTGLAVTAPVFGSRDIPPRIRGLMAFALALVVAPAQWDTVVEHPDNLINYATFIGCEILIGAILGLGIMILFQGIQVTGRLIAQVSGMALADAFDPTFDASIPVHAQLLTYITLAVFVLVGGLEQLIDALLRTYHHMPAGAAAVPANLSETFTALIANSFELGVRASAPVVTALLLSTLVMGLIGRTMPQFNILAVGFGMNAMMTLIMLAFSLGLIVYLFQDGAVDTIELMMEELFPENS
ncbi:MAG: flagellar biosynthetic protein FliR [Pirellulales bacterium]